PGTPRPNDLPAAVRLRACDLAALGVEVGHDITQIAVRHPDIDLDDRLQQHRAGLHGRLSNCKRAGDLEGYVRRVDGVVLAVHQADLHGHHRIAGDHPPAHGVDASLLHGGPKALRAGPGADLVLPHKAVAPARGLDLDHTYAVLPVSP